ncbi:MAG: DNA alkylation repair protein [bacterium]|nr:DNA alkylation repair protein [bacterium]
MSYRSLVSEIQKQKNLQKAKILQRFFKTGKGEYGEGDIFLGLTVPLERQIAKNYSHLPLSDLQKLLKSKIHEHRLVTLLILVGQYKKANEKTKKEIFDFYLDNTKNISNWDLVDLSAPNIVGDFLLDKDREILSKLAKSSCLWERRIAVLATYAFIKASGFSDTLKIAEILLKDKHDLIHKAVGWMLREVGKRDEGILDKFLKENLPKIPRTTLRYAIERFPETKRKSYLLIRNTGKSL